MEAIKHIWTLSTLVRNKFLWQTGRMTNTSPVKQVLLKEEGWGGGGGGLQDWRTTCYVVRLQAAVVFTTEDSVIPEPRYPIAAKVLHA